VLHEQSKTQTTIQQLVFLCQGSHNQQNEMEFCKDPKENLLYKSIVARKYRLSFTRAKKHGKEKQQRKLVRYSHEQIKIANRTCRGIFAPA